MPSAWSGVAYDAVNYLRTNGGTTPNMQWQGALVMGSVGDGFYRSRSPRAGKMPIVTQNSTIIVSVIMQNVDTGLAQDGLTLTIAQKKPGAGYVTVTPTVTPRSNGRYDLTLTNLHTNVTGISDFHVTAPGAADNDDLSIEVVVFDLFASSLNANVTGWNGSSVANVDGSGNVPADVQKWSGSAVAAVDGSGNVPSNVQVVGSTALTAIAAAILDAARSGHLTVGSIGEGVALSAALLQGNYMIDNVVNTDPNGPTSQRLRCWVSSSAMAGATPGGSGAQGAFATFLVTTTYTGPNLIASHKVVQQ